MHGDVIMNIGYRRQKWLLQILIVIIVAQVIYDTAYAHHVLYIVKYSVVIHTPVVRQFRSKNYTAPYIAPVNKRRGVGRVEFYGIWCTGINFMELDLHENNGQC